MRLKKVLAAVLCGSLLTGTVSTPVMAAAKDTPYVSLGADIGEGERATVLELMGITEEELQNYTVVYVTNEEEHAYLDAFLPYEVIGNEAHSCAYVIGKKSGSGISVTTKNIDYCTVAMYQNALATAGMKDADVCVVGATNISGTAGLIGVMEAYSVMTGEPIHADSIEAAAEELVTTGQLGELLDDPEKAADLIAAIKAYLIENGYDDPEKMEQGIRDVADEMGIVLNDEEVQKIMSVMQKIMNLDIDLSALTKQLKGIYDKLSGLGFDFSGSDASGFLETVKNWFSGLFNSISEWFNGLSSK